VRAVGIDIAKAGFCAAALAINGEPRRVAAWKNGNPRNSEPVQLVAFETWLKRVLWLWKPDIVAVEELAVFLNKKVIRTLSRREGVALLVAKKCASIVIHPPVTQSRSIVLGSPGNMPKEEAWQRIKKMYPDFDFGNANQGGMDKGDAMTHALAAETILERQ
jgi:Holliday junction resolvasome RuvABC endonuclease subunit